ncbi:MAG: ABC transporter substrate-binding protein [Betaproteobacteria bacterium]
MNSRSKFVRRVALLAIGAVLLLGPACVAAVPNTIKIGLLFGLTGAASPIGPVQVDGAKLAIEEVNEAGGLNVGGKHVKIEFVVKDDESKPDVGIRRFRELIFDEKVHVIVGQTFAPISGALNKEVFKTPIAYFPVNVVALDMFEKNTIAPSTFAIHGSAYAAGYGGASYIVKKLGYKNIVFFAPAYAFGWDQWKGAKAALDKLGAKYKYIEAPVGTADFTPYLLEIQKAKPDIVMMAHWGVDAINVLKQAHEIGLKKDMKIWFDWMTNVFGKGVPPEALDGVYSLMSWYWDMSGFKDKTIVDASTKFAKKFQQRYGYPPDPYSAMAYLGVKEALRGISIAKSVDPADIAKALEKSPKFDSMRGPGTWRVDHQPLFRYGAFVVRGKGPKDRANQWDLVEIIDAYEGDDYLPDLNTLGY